MARRLEDALAFWAERLAGEGVAGRAAPGRLRFADPEGLELELAVDASGDEPLIAEHPEVPAEHALRGFAGVRAYSHDPEPSRAAARAGARLRARGRRLGGPRRARGSTYAYDPPPEQPGIQGAGTVHHVAWATPPAEQEAWRAQVLRAGGRPTPVIDRFYFKSVYFREPSGVLFEIATIGPGFTTDEPAETLGQQLGAAARLRAPARADRGDRDAAAADPARRARR